MKYSVFAVAALAVVASFSSCKKKDDPAPVGKARIQYVNAVSQSTSIDVYEDDVRVDQNVPFKDISGYRQVDAKSRNIKVTANGSISPLLNTTINPASNTTQTIYLTKQQVGGTNLNALVVNDTLTGGTAGKAMVRFMNLAPSSGSLQVTNGGQIVGGLTYVRGYREFTRYAAVDPGSFNADVREGSSGNSILALPVTLEAGKYYTLAMVGEPDAPGGTPSTLSLLTVNNQ